MLLYNRNLCEKEKLSYDILKEHGHDKYLQDSCVVLPLCRRIRNRGCINHHSSSCFQTNYPLYLLSKV